MKCQQCGSSKNKFYRRKGGDFYKVCSKCTKLNAKARYQKSKLVVKPKRVIEKIQPLDRENLRNGLIAGYASIRCY